MMHGVHEDGSLLDDPLSQSDNPPQNEIWLPFDSSVTSSAALSYTLRADGLPIMDTHPGARATIYLDFDGETIGSTNYLAYSADGDYSTFNSAEQSQIAEAVRQIDAYFSMFDVTVTTVKPANLSTTPTAWLLSSSSVVGGYSFVGLFPNTSPQSFNNSGDTRSRQTGLAHELAHNFGLFHQSSYDQWGVKTSEYSNATDTLHGVLMGLDYAGTLHKFTLGHNSNVVVSLPDTWKLQDDLAIIANAIVNNGPTGYTGDGYRPDDFGGTISTATALQVHGQTQTGAGIIERLTDSDAFSFASSGGRYAIDVFRDAPSGVDLQVSIFDSAGNLLAHEDGDPRTQNSSMVNDQYLSLDLNAGTYYVVVSSHGNYADQGSYLVRVDPLPTGWNADDVGLTGLGGYTSYNAATGEFSMGGSGASVTGTADAFQFAYQTLQGDGSIIAKITGVENTNAASKIGLMIRESLDPGAKSAAVYATPSSGEVFAVRSGAGGSPATVTVDSGAAFTPVWLKLERAGNSISAFKSADGVSWSQIGSSVSVSMYSKVFIGLADSANNNLSLNDSTISNVTVTGNLNPGPTLNTLEAPTGLTVGAVGYNSVGLSWSNVAGNEGYAIERSSDGLNFTQIITTATGITSFTDPGAIEAQMYFYRVRAKNASGVSAASNVVAATARAGVVSGLNIKSIDNITLVLDWTEASGETGYRIEYSDDGLTGWTALGAVGANVNSFTDTTLTAGAIRSYRLVTLDSHGDSAISSVVTGQSRLPVVTGLTLSSVSSNSISFTWTDLAVESGYRLERSTDGVNFSFLANLAANATSYSDTGLTSFTEYYYRVLGTTSLSRSVLNPNFFAATPASEALPTPWQAQDIGVVGGPGASKVASGVFTVLASGFRIDGISDQFRFVYQSLNGDGSIVARVDSVEATNPLAKAGVMIRETTATGSKYAATLLTNAAGVRMQRRAGTDLNSVTTTGQPAALAPYWVRLTRAGNQFTSDYSADGVIWTTIGTQIVSMNSSVLIGLAATSTNNAELNASVFSNVTVSNNPPTVAAAAAASPNPVTAGTTSTLSVLGADDHGESGLTYAWAATQLPLGAAAPVFSVNGSNAAKSTLATFSKAGVYVLTATITDSGGLSVASSVTVTVNQAQTAIAVSPSPVNVRGGQQQQFTAIARDQFGEMMTVQPAFTWASTLGSITSGGLFTAPILTASGVVTATAGSTVGSAVVNAVNSAPVVSSPIPDLNVNEDASDVVFNLAATFSDPDAGETLIYSLISNTNAALISTNLAGSQLTLHFAANQFGVANLRIRATDVAGAFVEDNFQAVVNSVNDLPTISNLPDQIVTAGGLLGPIGFTISDLETSFASLALSVVSSNLTILPASAVSFGGFDSNRTLLLTAPAGNGGTVILNVTVADLNGGFASDSFTLTVKSSVAGDLTNDGLLNAADIDALQYHLGGNPQIYDLTGDNQVTVADVDYLLTTLMHRRRGDVDLDGDVDATDLSSLRSHLGGSGGGWLAGDFDGDGDIDASDLATLRANLGLAAPGFDPEPPADSPALASAPLAQAPAPDLAPPIEPAPELVPHVIEDAPSDPLIESVAEPMPAIEEIQEPESSVTCEEAVATEDSLLSDQVVDLLESAPAMESASETPAIESNEPAVDPIVEQPVDSDVDLLSIAWTSLFCSDSSGKDAQPQAGRKAARPLSSLTPVTIQQILG